MSKNPKRERTFVLVKPDGVKRGLVGEIIRRIEQRGLKIIALKMERATRQKIDGHYPKDKKWVTRLGEKTLSTYEKYGIDPVRELRKKKAEDIGPLVRGWLLDFMVSGPMVKMIIEGVHAVDMVRKLCGNTLPNLAEMGTIRGDYSVDSPLSANRDKRAIHNLIHASETSQEARHEISYWFTKKEIHDYKRAEDDVMF